MLIDYNYSFLDKIFIHLNNLLRKFRKFVLNKERQAVRNEFYNSNTQLDINHTPREKKIILSLTTFPPRFKFIPITLQSLLKQTVRPDKIIVWLGNDSKEITEEMKSYEQYGVEFIFMEDNLMPHKKFIYAIQQYPEDIIITADDDIIYPEDYIQVLMDSYRKYPNYISARRVHYITRKSNGNLFPYNNWINNFSLLRKPSHRLLATGGAGVLYPPHSLPQQAFNAELIKKYCLKADDIWLKFMELLNGTKVVWAPSKCIEPPSIRESQEVALSCTNTKQNQNDIYINNMLKLYRNELKNYKFLGEP